ncbi:MAG: hypothetical protein JXR64_03295 [Spirochaetales bacterium]|nr:hypothetical protein [Spirochaetales bacterium]
MFNILNKEIVQSKDENKTPVRVVKLPIAYAAMGIDTPKIFNYKMLEQNNARKEILNRYLNNPYVGDSYPEIINYIFATTNIVGNYNSSYVNELFVYKTAGIDLKIKNDVYNSVLPELTDDGLLALTPFLPGLRSTTSMMYSTSPNSLYHPNKIAGIDSLGMLMGAISMSDIDGNVLNVFNTEVNKELDDFNKSQPEFHVTNESNVLNKPYRFTRADIERSSVLLPDLSMARPGDILVNFTNNESRIGIIISADFSTLNANSTVEDYMKNLMVLEWQMLVYGWVMEMSLVVL